MNKPLGVMLHSRKLDKKRFDKSDSTRQYKSKNGKKCFQGVPGKLRETEIYPPAFGRAVLRLHVSFIYANYRNLKKKLYMGPMECDT